MGCAASVKTVPVDQYEVSETKVFKALAKGNREGDGEEADFSRVTTKTNSLEIGDGVSRTVTKKDVISGATTFGVTRTSTVSAERRGFGR
mmetsp:Transcript_33615/g.64950  ORF Transcript_33615/g.64950 Transcript_33615/m.64950 type:complete len:90 (+) Transcript_33615:150-419(+)